MTNDFRTYKAPPSPPLESTSTQRLAEEVVIEQDSEHLMAEEIIIEQDWEHLLAEEVVIEQDWEHLLAEEVVIEQDLGPLLVKEVAIAQKPVPVKEVTIEQKSGQSTVEAGLPQGGEGRQKRTFDWSSLSGTGQSPLAPAKKLKQSAAATAPKLGQPAIATAPKLGQPAVATAPAKNPGQPTATTAPKPGQPGAKKTASINPLAGAAFSKSPASELELAGQDSLDEEEQQRIYVDTRYFSFQDTFEKCEEAGGFRLSFIWVPILFEELWFLYRKMYLEFFVFAGIYILLLVLTIDSVESDTIERVIDVVLTVIMCITGKGLYWLSMKRKIAKSRRLYPNDSQRSMGWLSVEGGVNIWLPVGVVFLLMLTNFFLGLAVIRGF